MERHYGVASLVLPTRETNVAHYADQPTARNERVEALLPHLVKFAEELLVVAHVTELAIGPPVLLESPVGGRRNDKMYALRCETPHIARVVEMEVVLSGQAAHRGLDELDKVWK